LVAGEITRVDHEFRTVLQVVDRVILFAGDVDRHLRVGVPVVVELLGEAFLVDPPRTE
jgi:hypothetical protein